MQCSYCISWSSDTKALMLANGLESTRLAVMSLLFFSAKRFTGIQEALILVTFVIKLQIT